MITTSVTGEGDHYFVRLESSFGADMADFDDHGLEVVCQHRQADAGVLARLAWYAEPFIREQRDRHGCRPVDGCFWPSSGPLNPPMWETDDGANSCYLDTFGLLAPNDDLNYPVALEIAIPRFKVTLAEWHGRITAWLQAMNQTTTIGEIAS